MLHFFWCKPLPILSVPIHHVLAWVSLSVPPSLHKYKLHSSSSPDGSPLAGRSLPSWRPWLSGHTLGTAHHTQLAAAGGHLKSRPLAVMMLEVELCPSIRVTGDVVVSLLRMVKDMFGGCGNG